MASVRLFLSYTWKDKDAADKLKKLFVKKGYFVLSDPPDLSFGIDYAETLSKGIQSCSAVVALISSYSIQSQWFLKELEVAESTKKTIFPVLVGDIDYSDIPFSLRYIQMIRMEDVQFHLDVFGVSSAEVDTQVKAEWEVRHQEEKASKPLRNRRKGGSLISVLVILLVFLGLFWIGSPGDPGSVEPTYNGAEELVQRIQELAEKNDVLHFWVILLLIINVLTLATGIVVAIIQRRKLKKSSADLDIKSDSKVDLHFNDMDSIVIEKEKSSVVTVPAGYHSVEMNYMKYNDFRHINCFIAGSTALQWERDALRATISLVCNRWQKKKFQIYSFTYEDFDRKFTKDGQQPLYDYFIQNDADFAIFIIKGDVGDFTVKEFDKAYHSYQATGHPSIVVYNDRCANAEESGILLKERVRSIKQYWIDYSDLNEMRYHFQDLISTDLWNMYENELT